MDGQSGVGNIALPAATAALSAASPRVGAPVASALWSGLAVGQGQQEARQHFDEERRTRARYQDAIGNIASSEYGAGKLGLEDAQLFNAVNESGDVEGARKLLEQYRNKPAREVLTPYDQAIGMPAPPPGTSLEVQTDKGRVRRETPFATRPDRQSTFHPWGHGQELEVTPDGQRIIHQIPVTPREPKEPKAKRTLPSREELGALMAGEKLDAWPDWSPLRAKRVFQKVYPRKDDWLSDDESAAPTGGATPPAPGDVGKSLGARYGF